MWSCNQIKFLVTLTYKLVAKNGEKRGKSAGERYSRDLRLGQDQMMPQAKGRSSMVKTHVIVVSIGDSPCTEAMSKFLIPVSHSQNVVRLSPFGWMSSIPATIMPFNGARLPVGFV